MNFEFIWKTCIDKQKGIIYFFLKLLSYVYQFIIEIRVWLYKKKVKTVTSFNNINVISIGNISLGGTGKTPLVAYISQLLLEKNFKPCIISRGYGSETFDDNIVRIVTDGNNILLNNIESGDEPYMLAEKLKGAPIAVNKNRIKSINYCINNFDVNTVVLDDGFQRLNINKKIDIVIFDGTVPIKNYKMFPAGILREPLTGLKRADICIINKTQFNTNIELENLIKEYNNTLPVFYADYTKIDFYNFLYKNKVNIDILKNKNLTVFCGIGNSENFKQKIIDVLKPKTINFIKFSDHHIYTDKDLQRLLLFSKISDYLITTHKDIVKLNFKFDKPDNLLYTDINLEIKEKDNFIKIFDYLME